MDCKVFYGTIFETPEPDQLSIVRDALIVVDKSGMITRILTREDEKEFDTILCAAADAQSLTKLSKGQYFMPGFVDLHVHAPQWPQLGKALDRSLESWLNDYTFPLEAKYKDTKFASTVYKSLVEALLRNGTTCVAYFATTDVESSLLLAEICLEKGQRAVVGRVAMDLPDQCPEYYRDASPQDSVAQTEHFIQRMQSLHGNDMKIVLPAIIPRFIPTCSHEALIGLGKLVQKYGCHVQTHCSESDWEHQHVITRYGKHDSFALDDFGLLTRQTILAHCNYLTKEDMHLVKLRGSAVAHCPISNAYFAGAVFPLKLALQKGLHVGLGTDISGGPTAFILDVARYTVAASRMLEDGVDPTISREKRSGHLHGTARVDHVTAFYTATTMGGISLNMKVGRIAPGYFFDAVVIDSTLSHGSVRVFDKIDSDEDIFQKIVLTASPANIVETYVNGTLVYHATENVTRQ